MILNPAARVRILSGGPIYYKEHYSILGTRAGEHKGCNLGMQID